MSLLSASLRRVEESSQGRGMARAVAGWSIEKNNKKGGINVWKKEMNGTYKICTVSRSLDATIANITT